MSDLEVEVVVKRRCSKCGDSYPATGEFFSHTTSRGVRYWSVCKECKADQQRDWRKEHPEYYHDLRVRNPARQMLNAARCRSKEKGLPFNLTLEDINIPKRCPYLGIELQIKPREEGLRRRDGARYNRHDGSPSLDRIVPSKGYVKGNVEVISWRANVIKHNASPEELLRIGTRMKELGAEPDSQECSVEEFMLGMGRR